MRGCYLSDDELERAIALLRKRQPEDIARAIDSADHHARGEFKPMNTMAGDRWTPLGQPVDWTHNPTADPEFTWQVNRFWHLKDFGIAWRVTGDPRYLAAFRAHVDGWIATNPVPWDDDWAAATHFQRPGPWRLLEAGLRAEQFLTGWQFVAPGLADDAAFVARLHASLADHADWLSQRLGSIEINHAMMHMLGLLLVATALPTHPRAPYWRQVAIERFGLALYRQVGADGVHRELTPGYHAVSVALFLKPCLIGRLNGEPMPHWYETRVAAMARFAAASLRADGRTSALSDWEANDAGRVAVGQLGLLSDDDTLIAQGLANAETLWMFGAEAWCRLKDRAHFVSPPQTVAFPDSGYYVLRKPDNVLLFDAAAMGGPHGHADALSFEWSRGAHGLVVDPGRYTYEDGDWRRWFKSTQAHSTVTIDGLDQSIYVSSQAWQEPTARCVTHRFVQGDGFDLCDAEHDGYGRLADAVRHRRLLAFLNDLDTVVIIDRLGAAARHTFAARLHLAPARALAVHPAGADGSLLADVTLADGDNRLIVSAWAAGDLVTPPKLAAEPSWIAPRYAEKIATRALALTGAFAGDAVLVTVIQRIAPDDAPPAVQLLPADGPGHEPGQVALAFHRAEGRRVFRIGAETAGWGDPA